MKLESLQPKEAFVLGYFVGDGVASIGNVGQNSVELYGSQKDWFVNKILEDLGWLTKVTDCKWPGCWKRNIPKKFWSRMLVEWGFKFPATSRIKDFSMNVAQIWPEAFLAGLWQSDGNLSPNPSYTTVNPMLANRVQELLKTLGIKATVSHCQHYSRVQLRRAGRVPFYFSLSLGYREVEWGF